MTPGLVLFGIQAIFKAGKTIDRIRQDKLQGTAYQAPHITLLLKNSLSYQQKAIEHYITIHKLCDNDPVLSQHYQNSEPEDHWKEHVPQGELSRLKEYNDAWVALTEAAVAHGFDVGHIEARIAAGTAGQPIDETDPWLLSATREYMTFDQLEKDAEFPSPYARIGFAMADIALEYVSANPGVLGLGSTAEKFASGIAQDLGELIPDPTGHAELAVNDFAKRAIAVVLRSGLQTFSENADVVIGDKEMRAVAVGAIAPLNELMAAHPNEMPSLEVFRDAVLGPVVRGALTALADNQEDLLGSKFGTDKAVGAVTEAFIRELATPGEDTVFKTMFSGEGQVRIYKALLGVAVNRPELFVKPGSNDPSERVMLARTMLQRIAKTLSDNPVFTDDAKDLGKKLTLCVIEVAAENASTVIFGRAATDSWDKVAEQALAQVLNGLKTGLEAEQISLADVVKGAVNQALIIDLARIVLEQASKTPGMLTGSGANQEVQAIVAALSKSMAADEKLLLGDGGWRQIMITVTAEAARNPARLFNLDVAQSGDHLVAQVIELLLKKAAEHMKTGRAGGALLFGETLVEIIKIAVRTAAAKSAKTRAAMPLIGVLIDKLDELVAAQSKSIGAVQYVALFEMLLSAVIERGVIELVEVVNEETGLTTVQTVAVADLTNEILLKLLDAVGAGQ